MRRHRRSVAGGACVLVACCLWASACSGSDPDDVTVQAATLERQQRPRLTATLTLGGRSTELALNRCNALVPSSLDVYGSGDGNVVVDLHIDPISTNVLVGGGTGSVDQFVVRTESGRFLVSGWAGRGPGARTPFSLVGRCAR